MEGDLKLSFIQKALKDYMTDVSQAMKQIIVRKNARDTDTLLNSLKFKTYQESAQGNADLSFAEWGRMLDMGVGKEHPLSGIAGTRNALNETRKKSERTRKPLKIYSPIVYGKLNGLIGDLAYGFTEETIQSLKAAM